jgi:hypothetical protein
LADLGGTSVMGEIKAIAKIRSHRLFWTAAHLVKFRTFIAAGETGANIAQYFGMEVAELDRGDRKLCTGSRR